MASGLVLLGTLNLLLGIFFVLHDCFQELLGIFPGHLVGTRLGFLLVGVLLILVLLGLLLLLLLLVFLLFLFVVLVLVLILLVLLWRVLFEHIECHEVVVAWLVVVGVTAQAFAIGGDGFVVLFVLIEYQSHVVEYVREAPGVLLQAGGLLKFVDCFLGIALAELCAGEVVVCRGVVGIVVNCLAVLDNGFLGIFLYINGVAHYSIAAAYVIAVVLCTGCECKEA